MNIDIPDWIKDEDLYLISRDEVIAKRVSGAWKVKSVRCNKCGECCKLHPSTGSYFEVDYNGWCINLAKDGNKYVCTIGLEKPIACVIGDPEGEEYKKFGCCIEYKEK